MDRRSRMDRYKDLRNQVSNESEVKENNNSSVNTNTNTGSYVKNNLNEYDAVLKAQEDFLRAINSPFGSTVSHEETHDSPKEEDTKKFFFEIEEETVPEDHSSLHEYVSAKDFHEEKEEDIDIVPVHVDIANATHLENTEETGIIDVLKPETLNDEAEISADDFESFNDHLDEYFDNIRSEQPNREELFYEDLINNMFNEEKDTVIESIDDTEDVISELEEISVDEPVPEFEDVFSNNNENEIDIEIVTPDLDATVDVVEEVNSDITETVSAVDEIELDIRDDYGEISDINNSDNYDSLIPPVDLVEFDLSEPVEEVPVVETDVVEEIPSVEPELVEDLEEDASETVEEIVDVTVEETEQAQEEIIDVVEEIEEEIAPELVTDIVDTCVENTEREEEIIEAVENTEEVIETVEEVEEPSNELDIEEGIDELLKDISEERIYSNAGTTVDLNENIPDPMEFTSDEDSYDDIDRILADVKARNIETGIRNNEDTQVNILSEIKVNDIEDTEAEDQEDQKVKDFFNSFFGFGDDAEMTEEEINENISKVISEMKVIEDGDILTDEPQPIPQPKVEDVVKAEASQPNYYDNQEHINELTQRIEKERELREEMFEQTQQLKLQVSEYENELNDVNKSMSKTNKVLNAVITLLIIGMFVILIAMGYFFAKERGLI